MSAPACILRLVALLGVLAVHAHAVELFNGPGRTLDDWILARGTHAQIQEGALVLTATDGDPNPELGTKVAYPLNQHQSIGLTLTGVRHKTTMNHATSALEITLFPGLTIRLTTWGDGSGVAAGDALLPFEAKPMASQGVSVELTYDLKTHRLRVSQFAGPAKVGNQWKTSSARAPIVLLDTLLLNPPAPAGPSPLRILVRSRYNGGLPAGTRIEGIRLEAN